MNFGVTEKIRGRIPPALPTHSTLCAYHRGWGISILSSPYPPPPSLPPRHWFTIVLFVWSDKKRIHIRHPYTIIMYRFFIFHIVTLFGVVELDNNKHQFTTMKKLVILPYFCTYDTNLNLTGLTSDRHRQLTEFD